MKQSKVYVAALLLVPLSFVGTSIAVAANPKPPSINGKAQVIDVSERYVTVIEQRPVEECRRVQVTKSKSTSSHTPEILGLLLGGAIGKQLDDSDGNSRTGATIGAILGASIASDLEKKNAQKQGVVTGTEVQCTTVNKEVQVRVIDGYDVTYEYGGNLFTWKMDYRPSSTIPVKVYVLPAN